MKRWNASLGIALAIGSMSNFAFAHEHQHSHTRDLHGDLTLENAVCSRQAHALHADAVELRDVDPPEVIALLQSVASDTDVLHYDLELEIDPGPETITGTNVIRVESLIDGLNTFTFRLRSNYTITAASIGGTPVAVASLSTTTREATLDRVYNTGEVFELSVSYTGVAVSRGFGSIEFTTQSGNPLVSTLSEPYYSYTWWPCKDGDWGESGDNADKATIDIAIIAPSSMRSVANGLLQGIDSLSGGRSRYRWSTNYPTATYLVAFSSTNYNTWTETFHHDSGSMPVEFNIYPNSDTAGNRTAWGITLDMLDVFGDLYGPYPFVDEKYGIYQFPFGGGMEHQTNSGQSGFGQSLTAHELAHQWFGDEVTCRTWNDIWLNEGFATYSEALWQEFRPGSSGLPALQSAMNSRRPSSVGDSVYVYDASNLSRIFSSTYSYNKGSWVLHQLRHVLGDNEFFALLSAYRTAYTGSAATTDDFAALASAAYGSDMSWFFDEWVYGIGAPAYRYAVQNFTANGQNYARVYINQVQTSSYGTYTMPLDLDLTTGTGTTRFVLFNDAAPEHYVVATDGPVTAADLDPDVWVLTTSNQATSYVAGPAALLATTPAVDAAIDDVAPDALELVFSDVVSGNNASVNVVGQATGAVGSTWSFDAGSLVATISFAQPLANDVYTVTVQDSISANGLALDGTIVAGLPSGDGQPGGDAVYQFVVGVPLPCEGDLNGDGVIDGVDLSALLGNFGVAAGATAEMGDINGDGAVDGVDLATLLGVFGSICS